MAKNDVVIEVKVTDKGSAQLTSKHVKEVTKDVHSLGSAHDRVNNINQRANDTMNKGVTGTANSARNFSKLAQTIGDSGSGVVGAYATLAANIFAVTAAFNALRGAAQVEQIMNGLEASGARVGKTYSIVAADLKELTNNALSTEQSLRAVAQISSAGFGAEAMKGLTSAAFDASVALGRNLQDSMDRITRGVIKLEPELLDELGIMTKLTESNSAYAAALGKSASALTPLEKRQGFLNAVLAEANLKFGGLSKEAGDALVYDQLAATFNDLTKSVIGFLNGAALPLVKLLASSQTTLAGASILFASSISSQLLPGLTNLSKKSVDAASANRKLALESKNSAEASLLFAQGQKAAEIAALKNNLSTDVGAKKYKELAASVKSGTAVTEVYDQALKSLNRSEAAYRGQVDAKGAYTASAEAKIALIERERAALVNLRNVELNGAQLEATQIQKINSLRASSLKSFKESVAQNLSGAAIMSAGQGNITQSIRESIMAVEAYRRSQTSSKHATLDAMGFIRTSVFATTTAVRALGAAFLNAIPYIGQLVLVVGLLQSAWEAMKSAERKAYEKAREDLSAVISQTSKAAKELERLQSAPGSLAQKTSQSIILQSNAVSELVNAYKEATKARKELTDAEAEGRSSGVASTLSILTNKAFDDRARASNFFNIDQNSKLLSESNTGALFSNKVSDNQKAGLADSLRTLDSMNKLLPESTKKLVQFNAELDRIDKIKDIAERQKAYARLILQVGRVSEGAAPLVENLTSSLKAADAAFGEFYRSAIDSTSYDKTVDSLTQTVEAINDIQDAIAKGSAVFDDWNNMLLSIGPDMQKFLEPAMASLVRTQNEAVATRDRLSEIAKEDTLTGSQRVQLDTANRTIRANQARIPLLAQEVEQLQNQFKSAQDVERVTKSLIQLEQARITKSQVLYDASAKGVGARIDAENRLKRLQASMLEAQKAIIDAAILNNKLKLEQLRIEARITEEIDTQTLSSARLAVQTARMLADRAEMTAAAAGVTPDEVANILRYPIAARRADPEQFNAALALESSKNLLTSAEERLGKMREIRSAEEDIRGLQAASNALANQIAAILTSTVSAAEKRALMTEKTVQLEHELVSLIDEGTDAHNASLVSLRRQDALLNGIADNLTTRLNVIEVERSNRLVKLNAAYRRQVAELRTQIDIIEAKRLENPELATEGVRVLERRLGVLEQNNIAQQAEITSAASLQAVELVIFNTRKEGLEWQKQGLEYIQRQLDTQRQLADAEVSHIAAINRLRYKAMGLEMSPEAQQAEEIRAATAQYRLSVQEVGIKKSLIDLEFALLDAQREQLKDELLVRRERLAAENPNGVNNGRIAQLDSTIRTLTDANIRGMAQVAKDALDRNIETMAVNLRAAITTDPTGNNGTTSVLRGRQDRAAARREAEDVLRTSIRSSGPSIVEAVNTAITTNPQIAVIEASLAGAAEDRAAAERRIAAAGITVATATASTGEYLQNLARILTGRGFRISEMEGFGGVDANAHRGSGHESGRAFDLNIGTGNREASNPAMAARMDALAAELTRVGLKVLWRVDGHYDHMHVEITRTAAEQARIIAQAQASIAQTTAATETVAAAAISNIENQDIVVGAAPRLIPRFDMPDKMQTNVDTQSILNMTPSINSMPKPRDLTESYDAFANFNTITGQTVENLKALGPQGEAVAGLVEGMSQVGTSILDAMKTFDTTTSFADRFKSVATVVSGVLSTIQSVMASTSQAKIANIEAEIAAEQKRDGKSAASVARLDALEKKKDAIARKQFNANKKMMMAQAIIATATGITQALSYGPLGIPMAVAIGAMGAAQLAIIAGTSYQSASAGSSGVSTPGKLTIGKIGDSIDLAKTNSNPGGEIGYLRGAQGSGTNGSNYRVIGSAYGGRTPRGYGSSSFVVGEKGPEIATPDTPLTIRPMNDNENGVSQLRDVNFQIHALDAKGVEEILLDQRGNIISMLREAANSSGQRFMEDVKVENFKRSRV